MLRTKALGLVALLLPTVALAAATVTLVQGEVRVSATGQEASAPLAAHQRLKPGVAVTTGRGGQALLRFDDGQTVLLEQNSVLQIYDFRYREEPKPQYRSVMALLRGSARFVTGDIAKRDPKAFELATPHTILIPRGTDFMVSVVDFTYLRVLQGAVAANTRFGNVVFAAGQVGSVNRSTMPEAVSAGKLPALASTAFASMQAVTLPGGVPGTLATASGAKSATSAVSGGISTGAVIGIAAVAALVAAAAGGGGSSSTTSH